MSNDSPSTRPGAGSDDPASPVAELLRAGLERERAGRFEGAVRAYEFAAEMARGLGDNPRQAEALRRLGVLLHLRSRTAEARVLVARSADLGRKTRDPSLVGEALNTLASFHLESGELAAARRLFDEAFGCASGSHRLRAKIEQNLGVAANMHGDHDLAREHYRRAVEAFHAAGDDQGAATAAHNLGCMARERGKLDEAERCFERCRTLAERVGDARLIGLCALSRSELHLTREDFGAAREDAEAALHLFEELDAPMDKSAACRVLGAVFRETSRPILAEARLRSALRLAEEAGWVQGRAEASRELALLHRRTGRTEESIALLADALRLFGFLDARRDVEDIAVTMGSYEGIVRHGERVAELSVELAEELGLSAEACAGIRLGAYLHDVGKVKLPPELLKREGPLTPDERELVQQHTLFGELVLADVALPSGVLAIVRSHHERHDGSGYPDRLAGDQIPIEAAIVGLADVYDVITTGRSYRAPLPQAAALAELERGRHFWSDRLFRAFQRVLERRARGPERPTTVTAAPPIEAASQ